MPEPQLQLDRLRRLSTTQRSARLLLNYAARQSNTPGDAKMTVDSLHGILKCEEEPAVSRRELVQTLRAFAQAGCGRFVTGRHGRPSRFVWAHSLAWVGGAVSGGTGNSDGAKDAASNTNNLASEPKATAASMFSHPFRLRPTLVVSVQLPNDLTAHEADRLARFIQTLPFAQAES
jgi:hypothetical protein